MIMKNRIILIIFILILSLTLILYGYYIKKLNDTNIMKANNVTKEVKEETDDGFMEASDYSMINNYVSSGKTMIVIGRTGCIHCENYKPIVENLSNEYKFTVMYIDLKNLVKDDLNSLLDSNIMIPAKCTSIGENSKLRNGFGTPLTLFLENGGSYDCIRGYVDKDTLISNLYEANYIS